MDKYKDPHFCSPVESRVETRSPFLFSNEILLSYFLRNDNQTVLGPRTDENH